MMTALPEKSTAPTLAIKMLARYCFWALSKGWVHEVGLRWRSFILQHCILSAGTDKLGKSKSIRNSVSNPTPKFEDLDAAVKHVGDLIASQNIATSAAKGILYSLTETIGSMIGDVDLPAHLRSGYEGLLETARELNLKMNDQLDR